MAVMDVVVPCDCGSRFSFAVEPVNERLPEGAELTCPSCGKDGVPLANRVIGDGLRKQAREQAAAAAAAQPQKKSWRKKENKAEAKPADPYAYPNSDPYSEAKAKAGDEYYQGPNKIKGMAGALLGGAVGAAAWAACVYFTGYEIKYVAIAVGALAGLGSRTLGGGRDYHLGLFAATCALVAILAGQFVAAKIYISNFGAEDIAAFEYEFKVDEAKEAIALKTDADIRQHLAIAGGTLLKPLDEKSITTQQIADFKTKELPVLKKLASGETTKKQYVAQRAKEFVQNLTVNDIFTASITPYLFFWVFIGVGAAWKLASDYGTSVE
ncbi:MAG TPA: hypothetical protein VF773_05390 [Verrucomicrobiae bacterium]